MIKPFTKPGRYFVPDWAALPDTVSFDAMEVQKAGLIVHVQHLKAGEQLPCKQGTAPEAGWVIYISDPTPEHYARREAMEKMAQKSTQDYLERAKNLCPECGEELELVRTRNVEQLLRFCRTCKSLVDYEQGSDGLWCPKERSQLDQPNSETP